ncbi:MAG TPA: Hsp20/alpha crystallin family protein [Flexivirga sp.]|uniref:Hsp20/alpha crystallin family protein n=1 Tax=Flexivirga sp. TaxID=1962927 RepID=UPI002C3DA8A5|nr:Hsp20/alpha crystallin family protein [Flexivirga sp.]HWC21821.1 Hsp20/alpha crystallin family protein [Flexivirga sp.]
MRSDSISDFDALARNLLGMRAGSARSPQFMPIDLYRVEDHYVLHADLPGMDPGSIDVNIDRGVLTLTAHRTAPPENDVQWLTSERFAGVYRRQITLGDDIDTERIEASYDNGVLNLTIPLHERAKPRQIKVAHAKDSEQQHLVTSTAETSERMPKGGE